MYDVNLHEFIYRYDTILYFVSVIMSDLPTSPVAGDIAAFNKDGLKHADTQEKNTLPSSDGKLSASAATSKTVSFYTADCFGYRYSPREGSD